MISNLLKKLLTTPKTPAKGYEELLRSTPEATVVEQVRHTLKAARDYYELRGRKILAVDLQTHLEFFDEAVKFDVLEKSPVLLPTNRDRN